MVTGFFAQQRITTGAFDRLEADQVAQDAQRVRIGLEARAALLQNYGATNSIWDTSYDDVRTGDRSAFAADFPPADLTGMYGLDGVLGVGLDGTLRVGGLAAGDRYVAPPAGLNSAADLSRLFDPAAKAGHARCGVAATAAAPYLFCGFAAHQSDAGDRVSGGLIFLKSLGGDGLKTLSTQLTMSMALIDAPRSGTTPGPTVRSTLGDLKVSTRTVSAASIALEVSVPTVSGNAIRLEALRDRPIHQGAVGVSRQLMLLMTLVGALLFVAVVAVMRREVRRKVGPLRRTTEMVISSGDRTLRIGTGGAGDDPDGEIGALSRAIDRMLDAMATQDDELHQEQATREAQLRSSYVQQRLSGQHVRHRAQLAIDETATVVVDELQDVLGQAQAMQAAATSIDARVTATEAVARTVAEQAAEGDRTAAAVADSLRRVSGIAQLIAGVADQTKILALNATIESARAGAAGKGFAVVANEVKGLASTTTRSTGEITATLAGLERDVAAMSKVIIEMTDGVAGIGRETAALSDVAATQRAAVAALDGAVLGAIERIRAMSSVADSLERREHERVAAGGEIGVRVGGVGGTGELLDLSEGGARCVVSAGLPVTVGSGIELLLPAEGQQRAVRGVVVREVPGAEGREVAIEFGEPDDAARRLIRDHLTHILGSQL